MGELAEDAWEDGLWNDPPEQYEDPYGDDVYDWGEGDDILEEDPEGDEDGEWEGS
jgi:hypothetical protein